MMKNFDKKIKEFAADESGAGTSFAIIWSILCISIGGIAVDAAHVWSMESRLQATADIAAHAGIMVLVHPDKFDPSDTPEAFATEAAIKNMATADFGTVLVSADVLVGEWDSATQTMNTNSLDPDSVGVTTRLDGGSSNVVPTFLLRLIGFNYFEVSTSAVFQRILPNCFYDGLTAGGIVDLTSNNSFYNNFCIHGHDGVQLNDYNYFEDGVAITMADDRLLADGGTFDPKGGSNVGMWEAVGDSPLMPELTTLAKLNELYADLSNINSGIYTDPDHDNYIDYATAQPTVAKPDLPLNEIILSVHVPFDISMLEPNAVNVITCTNNGNASKVAIPGGSLISETIVVSDNCVFEFVQGSAIESSIFFTGNTSANSFKGANNVRLGVDDSCTPGGGSQFVTKGGVNFASAMEFYGSQIIAHGDVMMAAAAQGIEGVSVEAGGDISIQANNDMGLCGGGVDTIEDQYWYRMVY